MGLRSDFEELAASWRGSSFLFKSALAVLGVLALGPIASLAETVAKWKGFLLTGLNFYQEILRNPATEWIANATETAKNPALLDFLIRQILLGVALIRSAMHTIKFTRSALDRRIEKIGMSIFILLFLAVLAIISFDSEGFATQDAEKYRNMAIFGYGAVAFTTLLPPKGAAQLLLRVYLAFPIFIICILAAINLGLK